MPSRWDRLLDQKPVPLLDHLLTEAARLLAVELGRWPLPVEEVDPMTAAHLGPLLEAGSRRPPEPVFKQALRLVQWDLAREHEAYDEYVRNRQYLEHGVAEADRPAMLFVSRWVLEQLLGLAEATEGRVDRRALSRVVEAMQRGRGASAADA